VKNSKLINEVRNIAKQSICNRSKLILRGKYLEEKQVIWYYKSDSWQEEYIKISF